MTKEGYISTQAINDMLEYCRNFDGNDAICIFEKWFREQEPVQPKMGRWLIKRIDNYDHAICSVCGDDSYLSPEWDALELYKYCPNCGCAMIGE